MTTLATPLPSPLPAIPPDSASAPSSRRSFTRDQIVALGQSGDPFAFVPLALQALNQLPSDAALRFLLATNYARLLLRTPAAEQLRLLPSAAQADPSTQTLAQVLTQLPDDRISLRTLEQTLSVNLAALAARTDPFRIDLRPHLAPWLAWAQSHEFFSARSLPASPTAPGQPQSQAPGHNVLIRPSAAQSPSSAVAPWLTWFGDARAACNAISLTPPPAQANRGTPPTLIEGLQPPWLFQRIFAATPDQPDGHRIPIRILQADINEFLTGLALADLRTELADPRVHPFLGPDCSTRLASHLSDRLHLRTLGAAYRTPGLATGAVPSVHEVLTTVQTRQVELERDLRIAVDEAYADRTPAWYARRFAEALAPTRPSTEPLRVLVPTCRYSTFIQHSAHDIAAAFRAVGCQAQVIIEPDEFSHFLPAAYLQSFAQFEPDLLILINYTRQNLPKVTPANVPFVCWIQDAMPHLFDEAIGAAQTPLDFLAGHIHEELHTKYAYPANRSLSLPVMVSAAKFHPAPIDPALRKRLECEIAFVTHHSSPPEALHEQIIATGKADAKTLRLFESLFPIIRALVDESGLALLQPRLRAQALAQARNILGGEPPDAMLTRIINNYVFPIADRMIRYDAITWAAEICERRQWRFKLHGRGWADQPRFAQFAAGELQHGEELRASYQSAACHLHASIHWMYHQRVLECAASGGLPVYRLKGDDLAFLSAYAVKCLVDADAPHREDPAEPGVTTFNAVDHHESLARLALVQRLGFHNRTEPYLKFGAPLTQVARGWQGLPMSHDVAWLLGDPSEVGFRNAVELESVVEKAITLPRWKQQLSEGIARRTRANFTYDIAATRILGMIRQSLQVR